MFIKSYVPNELKEKLLNYWSGRYYTRKMILWHHCSHNSYLTLLRVTWVPPAKDRECICFFWIWKGNFVKCKIEHD